MYICKGHKVSPIHVPYRCWISSKSWMISLTEEAVEPYISLGRVLVVEMELGIVESLRGETSLYRPPDYHQLRLSGEIWILTISSTEEAVKLFFLLERFLEVEEEMGPAKAKLPNRPSEY